MTTKRGGARPGAGRPRKTRCIDIGDATFESAQTYLEAVVRGDVPPDAVRVRAAATLIRFEEAVKRVPKKALSPTQMASKEARAVEDAVVAEFEAKAAAIRARHARRKK